MATAVSDLIKAASKSDGSVTDLLRQAKVVASQLGQTETGGWIDAELTGKFQGVAPDYRKLPSSLAARNPYNGGMVPARFEDQRINAINAVRAVGTPIAELEDAIKTSDQPMFFLSLPPDAADQLRDWGAPTNDLYHGISRSSVKGLVEAVRTRVLEWALALDQAGVQGKNMAFTAEERKEAEGINIHFNGTTNFAGVIGTSTGIAAQNVSQSQTVLTERAAKIAAALRTSANELSGDDAELVNAAADSIENAAAHPADSSLMRKAARFGKTVLSKVGVFAAKAALEHEIGDLLDLIPM